MVKRKIRVKRVILLAFVIAILAITTACFAVYMQKPTIKYVEDRNFVHGEEIKVEKLVEQIVNGELLNGDQLIDCTTCGSLKVKVQVKNILGNTFNDYLLIQIKDVNAPVIVGTHDILMLLGDEVDLLEGVSAYDDVDEQVDVEVSGVFDFEKAGEYEVTYAAEDNYGNRYVETIKLVIVDPDGEVKWFKTANGYLGKTQDGITTIDGLVIVNKTYSLPASYKTNGLNDEAKQALNEMVADASSMGIELVVDTSFRSYEAQEKMYNKLVASEGEAKADTHVLKAGHSELQSGYALMFKPATSSFSKTEAYSWLQENCFNYGFVLRFPEGKEAITSMKFTPHLYRYVGKELASELYNDGSWLTIEEYFGIESKYQ